MDRTVRVLLKTTHEQSETLMRTAKQFTETYNSICALGWRLRQGGAYSLQRFCYHDNKAAWPDLVSDLHIQCLHKSAESLKSAFALQKKGRKVGCPQSTLCPPRYNRHTFRVDWQAGTVNLSTVAGRMTLPFRLPDYAAYACECQVATADLVYRKSKWHLHIVVHCPAVAFQDNGQALGVDLGICRPAVTSDNHFHGKRKWREIEKRRFRLRRKLQTNGSKSAKRHLKNLAGRSQRFRRDCDHVLSRSILANVLPGTTVVVENLTNIRTRVKASRGDAKRRIHAWSFAQLRGYLEYKAENLGARVVGIDPRHTSQRCNACGFTYRGNRRSQSEFDCRSCGHKQNADLNGAKNIRDKYLVGWVSDPSDGPSSSGLLSQTRGCQVQSLSV
jgi:putative transposase